MNENKNVNGNYINGCVVSYLTFSHILTLRKPDRTIGGKYFGTNHVACCELALASA